MPKVPSCIDMWNKFEPECYSHNHFNNICTYIEYQIEYKEPYYVISMLHFTAHSFFKERNINPFQPLLTQTKIEFSYQQQTLRKPKNIKVLRTAILYDTGVFVTMNI